MIRALEAQEVQHELPDVFPAFAQRRQADFIGREAVQKRRSKCLVADQRLQIGVGRREDPRSQLLRGARSERAKLAEIATTRCLGNVTAAAPPVTARKVSSPLLLRQSPLRLLSRKDFVAFTIQDPHANRLRRPFYVGGGNDRGGRVRRFDLFLRQIGRAMIERAAQGGAPKYMEWYGAFGLMVSLIWLYLQVLRLLSNTRRR